MATITINFSPPTPAPAGGYIVKYRPTGDLAYTTVSPNPTNSPIIITGVNGDLSYEGTIQSICNTSSLADPIPFLAAPTKISQLPWSVVHGTNPFTLVGFALLANGIIVGASPGILVIFPSSNNFNNVFNRGDVVNIRMISLTNQYPWEPGSSATMIVKVNDITVHTFTATTQSDLLHAYDVITTSATNKIELIISGQSTATNRLTRNLNTYLFYGGLDQLNVKIVDTSDSTIKLNIPPYINGDKLYYNVTNNSDTLTFTFANANPSTPRYIYFEGPVGFTWTGTIPPNTSVPVTGVPKGSATYLFDLEFSGYVRRGDFTKNNCPSGQVGGVVPFAKAYTDSTAADADTTNFNILGQARANTFGSCT